MSSASINKIQAWVLAALTDAGPGVRLRFAPKPDKDVRALREGLVDLEVDVLGEAVPEVRVQALFRDRFVGVVRVGHPLLAAEEIAPEFMPRARHAECAGGALMRSRCWRLPSTLVSFFFLGSS